MKNLPYNRNRAIEYASNWAFKRNPAYLDFEKLGGDCTNFVSQCIYAGSKIMNPKKVFGWYYYNSNDRTPSWTGVVYLYQFLTENKGVGPYAVETSSSNAEPGDIVQLGTESGHYYHSPIIVEVNNSNIFVAAHSEDAFMRPLNSYDYEKLRFLHLLGVRDW